MQLRTTAPAARCSSLLRRCARSERLPGPFKAELFYLASAYPNAELVPIFLESLTRAFPKGALFPVPVSYAVRFGTPISLRRNESKDEFLTRARAAIIALA